MDGGTEANEGIEVEGTEDNVAIRYLDCHTIELNVQAHAPQSLARFFAQLSVLAEVLPGGTAIAVGSSLHAGVHGTRDGAAVRCTDLIGRPARKNRNERRVKVGGWRLEVKGFQGTWG